MDLIKIIHTDIVMDGNKYYDLTLYTIEKYNFYRYLIQVCDSISMLHGPVDMEKGMADVKESEDSNWIIVDILLEIDINNDFEVLISMLVGSGWAKDKNGKPIWNDTYEYAILADEWYFKSNKKEYKIRGVQ